jgi:hypothetical protein
MRRIELAKYYLPPSPGRKTRHASRWRMSPEEAAARGLTEADKVPGTSLMVEKAETEEEERRAMGSSQSAGHDGARVPTKEK